MVKEISAVIIKGSSQLSIKKDAVPMQVFLTEVQDYGVKVSIPELKKVLWMVGNRKHIPTFKVGSTFHANNGNPCKRITLEVLDWE